MKILVCTDGSKESKKALEAVAFLAGKSKVCEVSVIHIYRDDIPVTGVLGHYYTSKEDFIELKEAQKKEGERILLEAKKFLADQGIDAKTILKGGHAAVTMAKVAFEEGYDLMVLGSRGLGGLKRLFLGSVSYAVLQESRTNVLVVK